MSDRVKRKCPKCKTLKLVRLIGAGAGIIFKKGIGGFYCKDYGIIEKKETSKEINGKTIKKGAADKKEVLKKYKERRKK